MSEYNPHKIIFILSAIFFGLIFLINNLNILAANNLGFGLGSPAQRNQPQTPKSEINNLSPSPKSEVNLTIPDSNNPAVSQQIPLITAKAALIYNLNQNKIIYAKNANDVLPIASLTKLMTAVVADENYSSKDIFIVGQNDLEVYGEAGSLVLGEKLNLNQILNILLISSSNRAAYVLARHMSLINFVDKMNQKAKDLGMNNAYYIDPSGLGVANQSNARDLTLLADYILTNHPELFKITQNPSKVIISLTGEKHYLLSTNEIINKVPHFIGGKTGLTDEARGCLLEIFSKDQDVITVLVLGSDDRFTDALKLINWVNKTN